MEVLRKITISSRVVQLYESEQKIASLLRPVSSPVVRALEQLIQIEGRQLLTDLELSELKEVEERKTHKEQAEVSLERLRADRARLDEAILEAERRETSLMAPILFLLCAAAAFCTEYVLNYQALNFLLDVEPGTLLAVATALAPAAAILVLEIIIERAFERPWRRSFDEKLGKRSRVLPMMLFLFFLAVANLATVGVLGEARAQALETLANPDFVVNPLMMALAVLSVSVVVAVNGAYFLLLARLEGRLYWNWTQLRLGRRSLVRRERQVAARIPTLTAELTRSQATLDRHVSHQIGEYYVRLRQLQLLQKRDELAGIKSTVCFRDAVDRILTYGSRKPLLEARERTAAKPEVVN